MNGIPTRRRSRGGSALILVLLSVAVLSIAVMQHVALVQEELRESALREAQFRCQQLAESGISIALLPGITPGDPALDQQPGPGESISVQIRSESARLNINQILRSNKAEVLERLFALWDVPDDEARTAAKALHAWTHPDSLPESSTPTTTDPGAPASAPSPAMTRAFSSVGDMALLPEFESVRQANPDWAASFTIWGPGQLDINEAAPELIAALCEIPLSQAAAFTERRAGPDRLPFTPDDIRYTSLPEALAALGLATAASPPAGAGAPATPLTAFLTITTAFRRIVSIGALPYHTRAVHAIARLDAGTSSAVLEWQE
ncbi:hypothetical protein DB346_09225 [Verrucomicrobia bacterium LW23]|nr:hypothetical protein DB346_09225 [Verrucomicrobia bacterium LW23]